MSSALYSACLSTSCVLLNKFCHDQAKKSQETANASCRARELYGEGPQNEEAQQALGWARFSGRCMQVTQTLGRCLSWKEGIRFSIVALQAVSFPGARYLALSSQVHEIASLCLTGGSVLAAGGARLAAHQTEAWASSYETAWETSLV